MPADHSERLAEQLSVPQDCVRGWLTGGMPAFEPWSVARWLARQLAGEAPPPARKLLGVVKSMAAVARHFGVNERTVKNWRAQRGMPGENQCWDLDEIAAWRESEFAEDTSAEALQAERAVLQTRKLEADVELRELKLRQAQGRVLEVDEVAGSLLPYVHTIRAQLSQLPERLAAIQDLPGDEFRSAAEKLVTTIRVNLQDAARELRALPAVQAAEDADA